MSSLELISQTVESVADLFHTKGILLSTDELTTLENQLLTIRAQAITDAENNTKQGNNEE